MLRKLLLFVRSLFCSDEKSYNAVYTKKDFSFKVKTVRVLYAAFFTFLFVNFAEAQTVDLFQFNFENTTAPNINNTLGTPTFSSNGLTAASLGFSTTTPCGGSYMYTGAGWDTGDYYRFTVNTTTYSNLKLTFCSRSNTGGIGEFHVRVSTDGTNWTVVDDFDAVTGNLTQTTSIFPAFANNKTTLYIDIYKSEASGGSTRTFLIDNVTLTSYAIPTITSFTGSPVCSGATPTVVITGTNLTGATAVNFNGTPATSFTVNSSTQITATLPASASTGYITVTTPGGTAASSNAFVVNPLPTITASASPTSVISGGASTLTASITEKTILLQEGFNGPTNSWNPLNSSTGGSTTENANAAWMLQPAGYYYYYGAGYPGYQFKSNDNSQFYLTNSAIQGSSGNTLTYLQSPAMNTTGYTSLSLEFYQFFLKFTDGTDNSYVEVSTNGTSWTQVLSNTSTQGGQSAFAVTTVSLNSYINQPTLYIRFRYVAKFDWFWAIDNVTVSGNKAISGNYSWLASPAATAGLPANAGTALSTNNSITVNPTQTTNYTVTATNTTTGCSTSGTPVTVTILPPTITSFTGSPVCSGATPSVVITGTNFIGATAVNFNGLAATSFTVNSNTQITAVLPATATTGTITVTTAGGTATSGSNFVVNRAPASLSYTTSTASYCRNAVITANTPSFGTVGSPAPTFGVSPALPTGLALNPTTGNITGTPSVATPAANYTITATNSCGSTSTILNITVTVGAVTATGTITGTSAVCQGASGVSYSVPTIANATGYNWTLPSGATIVSGANTNNITVDFSASASSGNITVQGTSGCGNGPVSTNYGVTVVAVPVGPVIAKSSGATAATVCAGTTLSMTVTTAGTGGTGTSQDQYRYDTGSGFTAWSTTVPSFTAVVGTNTIESRRTSTGTGCTTASGNTLSWTVVTAPVGPVIAKSSGASAATVCAGATLTMTVTTAGTGGTGTSQDEYRYDTGSGFGSWSTTVPSFTAVVGTNTIESRRTSTGTGCTTASGNTLSWTVVAIPVGPVIAKSPGATVTVCAGTTLTMTTTTAGTGGTGTSQDEYRYNDGSGLTAWSTTVPSFTAVVGTNTIESRRTSTGTGCTTASGNTLSWTVVAVPVGPVIAKSSGASAATVCAGTTLTMTVTTAGTGGTGTSQDEYRYDTGSGFGSWSTTVPSFTAVVGTNTIESRRTSTGAGCTTASGNTLSWTVVAVPVGPAIAKSSGASAATVCAGTTLTMTVTTAGTGGTGTSQDEYRYNNGSGLTAWSTTVPSFTAVVGTNTIESRRTSTGTGCTTASGNTLSWTVVAVPVGPAIAKSSGASAATVCAGTTLTMTVTTAGTGGTGTSQDEYRYNNGSGFTAWSTTVPSFTAVVGTNTIESRRTSTGTGCTTASGNTLSWTVVAVPVGPVIAKSSGASAATVCSGTTLTMTVTTAGTGGTGTSQDEYRYDTGSGFGSWSTTIPSFTAVVGTNTIESRRISTGTGCTTASGNTLSWTVVAAPVGPVIAKSPGASAATVCAGTTLTMTVTTAGTGGTGTSQDEYRYDTGSGFGSWSTTVPSFTAVVGTNTIESRRTSTGTGCTTASGNTLSWTVVAVPVGPVIAKSSGASAATVCSGTTLTMTVTTAGTGGTGTSQDEYRYDTGSGFGSWSTTVPSFTAVVGTNTIESRRTSTGTGCTTASGNTLSWTVVAVPVGPAIAKSSGASAATVCAGTTLTMTVTTAGTGGTGTSQDEYRYNNGSGFTAWSTTVPSFTAVVGTNTIESRRTSTGTGCTTASGNTLSWIIVAVPVGPVIAKNAGAPGATVCTGTTLTLTVTTAGTGGTGTSQDEYRYDTGSGFGSWSTTVPSFTAVVGTNIIESRRTSTGTGCTTASGNTLSWIVNPLPTITTSATPAEVTVVCASTSVQTTDLVYTASTQNGTSYSIDWATLTDQGSTSYTFAAGGGSVTGINVPANTAAGTYTGVMTITNGNTCSVNLNITLTIKPNYPAPTVGTIVYPNCTTATGSVTLTGLPASGNLLQSDGTTTTTIPFSTTTLTISGLAFGTYRFGVDNGCTVTYSTPVTIGANTWNGTAWSYTTNPTSTEMVNFASGYTISADVTYCSVTVSNGAAVTVASGKTLTVTNGVHVVSGSSLTFEDSSNLLQTNTSNTLNTGNIFYNRIAPKIRQADYVYWSTPVKNQTLAALSPLTSISKLYAYDGSQWVFTPRTTIMAAGKGYIVRGPENYSNTSKADFPASFWGTPQNGTFTGEAMVGGKYYLLGNPYPSALDATTFITDVDNRDLLSGTLYFWTHNTPVVLTGKYQYKTDDYATWNLSGGTGTRPAISASDPDLSGDDPNDDTPSGQIASGQAFFTGTVMSGNVTYKNSMRIGGNSNGQFFKPGKTAKTAEVEKHRVWLNMTNAGGAFKQLLVAYIEGATNGYERLYDGKTFDGNKFVDFYSINEDKKLVIQGRGLPFTDVDEVPLGYRTTIAGDFTIAINKVDGNMKTQAIYLEDKKTGTLHDLRASNYTFATEIGTFADRFVLRYTNKSLGTGDFENVEKGITVSVKDKVVKVVSSNENIQDVSIFDVAGKLLYNKKKAGTSELLISNLQSSNQVLLIDITLENGYKTTRKLIFQ